MNSIAQKNKIEYWVLASRPKTLLAAVVPVMVGSALAVHYGLFFPAYSIIALLCSVLIQIGTNFTNDLYDFLRGADTLKRKGPQRVLVSGLISVKEMKGAILITFGAAFFLGLYLVMAGGFIIFVVGVISIIAGLAYTAGPYPLAYNGLGDVFVFVFFGIIGTVFTFYLHSGQLTALSFIAAIPVGALITNILIVNNYRDIEEDRSSNKNTLAVIFGKRFSKHQYFILLFLSYLSPVIMYFFFRFNLWILLPLITLPIGLALIKMLTKYEGESLNKTLELTAKFSAVFGLLFSIGIIL
jgi:1,4-dihydroxy-2-naphthoate polyprenyltransferase